jgi:hypothetical protein
VFAAAAAAAVAADKQCSTSCSSSGCISNMYVQSQFGCSSLLLLLLLMRAALAAAAAAESPSSLCLATDLTAKHHEPCIQHHKASTLRNRDI